MVTAFRNVVGEAKELIETLAKTFLTRFGLIWSLLMLGLRWCCTPYPGTNCKQTHVIFVAATGGPIHRRDGIVLGRSKCQKWILRKKLIVLACKHSI